MFFVLLEPWQVSLSLVSRNYLQWFCSKYTLCLWPGFLLTLLLLYIVLIFPVFLRIPGCLVHTFCYFSFNIFFNWGNYFLYICFNPWGFLFHLLYCSLIFCLTLLYFSLLILFLLPCHKQFSSFHLTIVFPQFINRFIQILIKICEHIHNR